jgi:hypothetical protein
MDRGRVGEDRGSKETDGCPLTIATDNMAVAGMPLSTIKDFK